MQTGQTSLRGIATQVRAESSKTNRPYGVPAADSLDSLRAFLADSLRSRPTSSDWTGQTSLRSVAALVRAKSPNVHRVQFCCFVLHSCPNVTPEPCKTPSTLPSCGSSTSKWCQFAMLSGQAMTYVAVTLSVEKDPDVYYNAGPLMQLWRQWGDQEGKEAVLQLLCDGAHFGARQRRQTPGAHAWRAKQESCMPGRLIARRIMEPRKYPGRGQFFVRSPQAIQAVWVEHCI
jgi:hypothetical protein